MATKKARKVPKPTTKKSGGTRRSTKRTETAKQAPTGRECLFVEEYLIDLNAAKAAGRAGYAKNSARQTGHRLLTLDYIQDAIATAMQERSKRTEVTADWVMTRLAHIADFDITDIFERDEHGRLTVKDLELLPRKLTGAIESITQTSTERQTEDGTVVEKVRLHVKAHSALGALKMLFDHLGMSAPQQVENTVSFGGLPGGLTREQIRERATRLAKGAK